MGQLEEVRSPVATGEIRPVLTALAALKQEIEQTRKRVVSASSDAELQANIGDALHHIEAAYQLLYQLI